MISLGHNELNKLYFLYTVHLANKNWNPEFTGFPSFKHSTEGMHTKKTMSENSEDHYTSNCFQFKWSIHHILYHFIVNTLRPRQNGRRFADDTFKCIFLNENVRISIEISLKFVPKGPINNVPSRVGVNSGVGVGVGFNSNSNSGVGIGVETSGVGVGVGVDIQETCRSWSWSWNSWSWSWSWYSRDLPELELELKLPELELELKLSGVGVGIRVEILSSFYIYIYLSIIWNI